jgi:hypothetical protein
MARNSLTCAGSGRSASSSRKSVPPVGGLEQPLLVGQCAGEAALLVPEQLALDQIVRDGPAVDRHERTIATRPLSMDQTRGQLLAGAALAGDEDRRLSAGELGDQGANLLHRR